MEAHGRAVLPGGQLETELQPEIVRWKQALKVCEELDVAEVRDVSTADLIGGGFCGRVGLLLLSVGPMVATDVRQQQIEIPVRGGSIAHTQRVVAVDRLFLDLPTLKRGIGGVVDDGGRGGGAGAPAQLVLIDVGVFEIDAPARGRRVAHGGIGVDGASAGGARPTAKRNEARDQRCRDHERGASHGRCSGPAGGPERELRIDRARRSIASGRAIGERKVQAVSGGARACCARSRRNSKGSEEEKEGRRSMAVGEATWSAHCASGAPAGALPNGQWSKPPCAPEWA